MPEVAGDAAVLVDPTDVASIADGLRRLTTDAELRAALIQAGHARAKGFNWEKSVESTWKVYQELTAKS
jgi:glycosyltransferase involved in cell wall biosynthesis